MNPTDFARHDFHAFRAHCAVCDHAVVMMSRGCTELERGTLITFVITHQQNDAEREAFYQRYVSWLAATLVARTTHSRSPVRTS